MKKILSVLLVLVLPLQLAACAKTEKTRYQAEFLTLFDTVTTIVGYTDSKEEFTQSVQRIHDELRIYHELYDIYNNYDGINNLKTVNEQAGIAPVQVDQKIIDLLLFSKDAYEKTDGKVNIAFGAVLEIWHNYRTEGIDDVERAKLPPIELLEEAAKHTDINQVIIDTEASTVYLADPAMRLDVGSIGKGYATEQVSRLAQESGFTSGLISVGGNVRAIGGKEGGSQPWNVGIQNPEMDEGKPTLDIVELIDLSMVTSGDYQRYYTVDGKRYHHIIDPQTLMPSAYFTAVTILCEDSGMADVLSTAVFNMPYEMGLELIERLPDTEALWIMLDGEIRYSGGFRSFIKA